MDTYHINKARIVYYGLFAASFSFYLEEQHVAVIEQCVDLLSADPMDAQSGKVLANLRRKLKKGGYTALKNESDRIFYSPATAFVPMTASYYTEQKDDGQKRMEMIGYLAESKFRRDAEYYKEQEDHFEFIFLFLQKLIEEELNGDGQARFLARKVVENILHEVADQFCKALLRHEESFMYQDVALALQSFMAFERFFLGIDAANKSEEGLPPERTGKRKTRISQEFHKKNPKECV